MSAGLRLYLAFLSSPCRAVHIALKQSGAPFIRVQVALRKNETLRCEFKNINRLRTVPCIIEGDLKLAESVAILRYLSATNRISANLYTSDVKKRAEIDAFLEWQHGLRSGVINFFRLSWLFPILSGNPTPKAEVRKAKEDMEKVFEMVENTWLASSKFVAGNQLSVADIMGVCEVEHTKLSHYDLSAKYPKMVEWVENVRQGTGPDFDDTHKILYKIAQRKYKGMDTSV